LQLLQH